MNRKDILLGLALALLVALLLSPLASKRPDGLEKVAQDQGFAAKGEGKSSWRAPVAGYVFPGIKRAGWTTAIAGFGGTLVLYGLVWSLAKIMKRRRG